MVALDLVVAIGGEHERFSRVDAPAKHAQDVERGLVGPVHVLEHEQRRPRELVHERRRHAPRLACELDPEVEERPERGRRRQVLARTEQYRPVRCKRPHEGRLAHTRLAPDEEQAATLGPGGLQPLEQLASLEQLRHVLILRRRPPRFNSEPSRFARVPRRQIRLLPPDGGEIAAALAELRESLDVSLGFPDEVLADAESSVASPRLPDADQTEFPFVTIDPPESMDLDQALHLERNGNRYRVRYAIADVAAFVDARWPDGRGGARPRRDALRTGRKRTPLPATALRGRRQPAPRRRPAGDRLGDGGRLRRRGRGGRTSSVRSSAAARSSTTPASSGRSTKAPRPSRCSSSGRSACSARSGRSARTGSTSASPSRRSSKGPDGWKLSYRAPLPVERWNAQISLMAGPGGGRADARDRIGILRTLPARRSGGGRRGCGGPRVRSASTGPTSISYADVIRTLDPELPAHAAFLAESTVLLRGSGYAVIDGRGSSGGEARRASERLTPIRPRRCGGSSTATSARSVSHSPREPTCPTGLLAALPALPETMERSNRRAQQYEAGVVSTVEAAVLAAQRRRGLRRGRRRGGRARGRRRRSAARPGRHRTLRG